MLQTIHDKITGWVAYVVLGAIALVFVLWGINWSLGAPSFAAKVNGREVSINEVRQAYQQQLAQFQRATNGAIDDNQRIAIKKRVLDDFVNNEALVTRIDALGYRVSDPDLLKSMAQIPVFQVGGKFDEAHAVAVLKAQGRSISEIETLLRRQGQLEQLDTALGASSFATLSELSRIRALTTQQRELAWVSLPASRYAAAVTPDEAALKSYYDLHKSEYLTPETVNLRFVEISLAELGAKMAVSDAQLKAYFAEQKTKSPERFAQTEKRRVRHILFQVTEPKDDAAARVKAEGILKRAKAGEDFSKLAKEFSDDTGSAQQGGDLGWSERKVWVAPFADAAFKMQVGDISGIVKTQFGYHILKLDGIEPSAVKTFEQSRSDLEAEYRRNESERLFNSAQDQLADAALQNTTDIDVVARKAGLVVQQIAQFSRGEGGGTLGKAPKVLESAFSQDVLDGRLSSIVEVGKGRGVVLRATDHKLPQQKPLEAVRVALIAAWKKQRGIELAKLAADDAAKRLSAGESWETVAKPYGAMPPAPARFVARTEASVPAEILAAAFAAPKPASKPIYQSVALADGDAALFALSAVRTDPKTDVPQAELDLRRQYAGQMAALEAQSYAVAARAAAKVSLNPQAID